MGVELSIRRVRRPLAEPLAGGVWSQAFGWASMKTVEKLLNYFIFLHLKYENKNKNDKVGHERELMKY
jgi:hypothetical protein